MEFQKKFGLELGLVFVSLFGGGGKCVLARTKCTYSLEESKQMKVRVAALFWVGLCKSFLTFLIYMHVFPASGGFVRLHCT